MNALLAWFKGRSLRVRVALVGGVVVLLFGSGFLSGSRLGSRVDVKEVGDKQVVLTTQYQAVKVDKPVDKWHTQIITHTEYDPACHGQVISTTVTKEDDGEHQAGSETVTTSKAADSEHDKTAKETSPAPESRWRAGILGGLSVGGGYVVGAEVGYKLVGPLEVGGWGILDPSLPKQSAAGVSVGLRF